MPSSSGNNNVKGKTSTKTGIISLNEKRPFGYITTSTGVSLTKIDDTALFGYVPAVQYFDVINSAATVQIACSGGGGGKGMWNNNLHDGAPGGYCVATYMLPPGRYYVFVGEGNKVNSPTGGAGGGSSDVRTIYTDGGDNTTYSRSNFLNSASLNSRICVAGGGGGAHGGAYGHWDQIGDRPGSGGPVSSLTNAKSTYTGADRNGADLTRAGKNGGINNNSLYTGDGAYGAGGDGTAYTLQYAGTASSSGWGWPNGGAGTNFTSGGGGGGWYGGATTWQNGGGGSNYAQSYGNASLLSVQYNTLLDTNYVRRSEILYDSSAPIGLMGQQFNGGTSAPSLSTSVTNPAGANRVLRFYTGTSDSYTYWSFRVNTNVYGASLTNGTYTMSYYAKLDSGSSNLNLAQIFRNGTNDQWNFSGANPTFTNQWKRYYATGTVITTAATYVEFFPIHSGALLSGQYINFWGFQFEPGSTYSPYRPGIDNGCVQITLVK